MTFGRMDPARHCIVSSPDAEARIARAVRWVAERQEARVVLVGASIEAASEVARRAVLQTATKASLGWHRTTLDVLAVGMAKAELARRGLVPASRLALEAVCAHVVHENAARLGRFAPIADRPGFPRALARTLDELRLFADPAEGTLERVHEKLAGTDLGLLLSAFEAALEEAKLVDRAGLLAVATEMARAPSERGAILFFDVDVPSRAERDFVRAVAEASTTTLATIPDGDERTLRAMRRALGEDATTVTHEPVSDRASSPALSRLKEGLFGVIADAEHTRGEDVAVLSAPGESREAVEIARIVLREAARGTRFDAMAVLLRNADYAEHLEEAFRRARVPAHFARGTKRPDPAGRALLALVACAAEGLSVRRFVEYLSLGEFPESDAAPEGHTTADRTIGDGDGDGDERRVGDTRDDGGDRFAAEGPTDERLGALLGTKSSQIGAEDAPPSSRDGEAGAKTRAVRTPRRWEELLVGAAVIDGKDRWARRLDGLHEELTRDAAAYDAKGEDALAEGIRRDIAALEALRDFARPILAALAALPGGPDDPKGHTNQASPANQVPTASHASHATWGDWIAGLEDVARRAIRHPERVLALLAELRPMEHTGPVDVTDVRLVLERHLLRLARPETGRRFGRVYVATIPEARGLAFDVVFVPGLAEKIFPQKVSGDPLLLDDKRRALELDLPTNDDRSAAERFLLRLAVGAARKRVVLSYPRLDVEQARPRTPSFYGLEVLRVAEGKLRGFEHLAEIAAKSVESRIGWPAPANAEDAIDEAEHDLALLDAILRKPEDQSVGEAHYLLNANAHLARALRFRGRRWLKTWRACDGLVDPPEEALNAIRAHALDKRSFSPTALQNFSACPYRFYLSAILKLAPREEPVEIEDLDPLTRGSLVHEVQFELLTRLRDAGLLPVTKPRLEAAFGLLDEVLKKAGDEARDRLKPAIDRIFTDTMESIAADLREWLRRAADDPSWTPAFFELSFGLKDRRDQDEKSSDAPVALACGIQLRGSIDLIERDDHGRLRATDHKTGKIRAKEGATVIGGGEVLQPVLYALTIEKLFEGTEIVGGRLYYCTAAGDFTPVDIPLTDEARAAADLVGKVIGASLTSGFLPAAPAKDACKYCDYRSVCGPYEEIRARRKQRDRLRPLLELRSHR